MLGVRILLVLIVAAASALLQSYAATTYRVGDSFGWNSPSGGFSYSNWASQHTFLLGDSLDFEFSTGTHTVARVNQNDYDNCNTGATPISLQTTGPATFTLNQTGPWYFMCTVLNHCSFSNQKLLVTVTSSSARSPSGSPSPGSSPNAPPPPPPNSANYMSAITVTSLLFLFVATAFLF